VIIGADKRFGILSAGAQENAVLPNDFTAFHVPRCPGNNSTASAGKTWRGSKPPKSMREIMMKTTDERNLNPIAHVKRKTTELRENN
jgi:hypothetical protein